MKIYTLKKEQIVLRPLDEVFAFFAKPENLAVITPPSLSFKILSPTPIVMKVGQSIHYKIKILGVPLKWTSLISAYEPPHFFSDEQLKGPYAYWHHLHHFTVVKNGTLIQDEVKYGLPFKIFGALARRLFVAKNLERIFSYRESKIQELFREP